MSDKIKPFKAITGGGKPDDFKQAIRDFREELDDQKEFQSLIAQVQRAKYQALIQQGFTKSEALELSKTISV